MSKISGIVTTALHGLKKYQYVASQLGDHPAVRRVYHQWAARYRGFSQKRFVVQSRGGGEWPDLAPSTIKRRRKGKGTKKFKKGSVAILRDKNLLFGALAPTFAGQPGAMQEIDKYGVRIGYGGPSRHGEGLATIADIASFHQAGGGFLPQRKIIVRPPQSVIRDMAMDMERALKKL